MSSLKKFAQTFFSDIKEIPPVMNQKYIPSLDGLRAFSVILVVVSHLVLNQPNSFIRILNLGGFGVNIFFIISGFLITTLLIKEKVTKGRISLRNFYVRRALRILPVVYLFLLVLLILNKVFVLNLTPGEFLRPALFVENFGDHSTFGISGHFWSLSIEEQFYLIFPFILTMGLKGYAKTIVIALFLVPFFAFAYYHVKPGFLDEVLWILHRVIGGSSVILVGSIFSLLVCKYPNLFVFKFKYIELVQLLLLGLAYYFYRQSYPAEINTIFCAIPCAILVVSTFCNTRGFIFRVLNYKPVMYVGTLSYSMYVWQQMFTCHQPWANSFSYGGSVFFNLPLLIVTTLISYHLYEKFFLNMKNRFSRLS